MDTQETRVKALEIANDYQRRQASGSDEQLLNLAGRLYDFIIGGSAAKPDSIVARMVDETSGGEASQR